MAFEQLLVYTINASERKTISVNGERYVYLHPYYLFNGLTTFARSWLKTRSNYIHI